ncbi:MAG: histone deacetylase [Pacificimonas sp.]|jgi:acetoin utilization deacetylase AcuC-like enzyme|nr:histone deacetylase [Pacificimonas sp.]
MPFPLFHHPHYVAPLPAGSSFPMNKYGLLMTALREMGAKMDVRAPRPMPERWIAAAHDPDYAREVLSQTVPPEKERRIGFPVTARVTQRSQLSLGGTYEAALAALETGFAANGAGGSHHALPGTGAGYCVLNDLAVAANRLLAEKRAGRILIVDLDVHQGDGTAVMLAGRPDAFTYSLHAEKNFPVRKARSSLDVGVPDGLGDSGYLARLDETLSPAFADFAPDLVLYQAGVDPHQDDRLGRLSLTDAGLAARDAYVRDLCREAGVPFASVLGGGYSSDAGRMTLARRHARSILTCAGQAAAIDTPSDSFFEGGAGRA